MSITVPIADPNRKYREWNIVDIYGHSPTGQNVPNKDDKIIDWSRGFFRVTAVDYTTNLSVLTPWEPLQTPGATQELDALVGGGPGQPWESYRAFLDTSVTPHVLNPERRLHTYSADVINYKIFKGIDTSAVTGRVISLLKDQSGNVLGDTIPMESVNFPGMVQNAIKFPAGGYTLEKMEDGDLVTLVAYSAESQVSEHRLVVKNTGAVRQQNAGVKYVTGISLDSAFLSSADQGVIEFPLNVAVQALPMTALVHYSTGEKIRYPLDDTRFSLWGRENYIASVIGDEFDFTLACRLNNDEVSYNQSATPNRLLTKPYKARTIAADGAYEVKLFVYPTWVSATNKYRLDYWLYNMDREAYYNVTNLIELGANSDPFDPTIYGQVQTVTVALDLSRVDSQFRPYRHPQTFQITLMARGDENTTNWQIAFRPDQGAMFGAGVKGEVTRLNANAWTLSVKCGATTLQGWLDKVYFGVEPLRNLRSEPTAVRPTHFRVVFLHNTYEYAVEQWDQALAVINDLTEGQLLYLQWIRRTPTTDLQLAITGLPVHQING